jgi:type III restriction enzyme
MQLRKIEEIKIECARKFFDKIASSEVRYDVVDSFDKLIALVK